MPTVAVRGLSALHVPQPPYLCPPALGGFKPLAEQREKEGALCAMEQHSSGWECRNIPNTDGETGRRGEYQRDN